MRLALAPIPFFWPADVVADFYAAIASTAIDIVYLGETVCYKRRGPTLAEWLAIADRLADHGKEVVLSSLVLVDGEAELKATRRVCANGRYLVEANDMSAVSLCRGSRFVAGATLNIYNEDALAILAEAGATRVVASVELSGAALAALRAAGPTHLDCEVLAFGRPALAYSARCFSARNADRGKDQCEWICEQEPEGVLVRTQEDDAFLTLNGLQIHAGHPINVLGEIAAMREAGVDILRIMPEIRDTALVVDAFRGVLDGRYSLAEAQTRLVPLTGGINANGYWRGVAGRSHAP